MCGGSFCRKSDLSAMFGVAGRAVDGLVVAGLEGNLGGCAAVCAHCIIHFPLAAALLALAVVAAILAADGLILESLLRIKLLLAGSENEFAAAVPAYQCLVFVHVLSFPFKLVIQTG